MHKTAAEKKLAAERKSHKGSKRSHKNRKYDRNKKKCEKYRAFIGKPNGPGQPGNKAGKNKS